MGGAGGALFHAIGLPLAWMLGSVAACALAAILGMPVATPRFVRPPMSALIGIILGTSVTVEILRQAPNWLLPIVLLPLFLLIGAAACIAYFRHVGGMDRRTAYFAGMPGGLVEMVILAEEQGTDERAVSLIHAMRVFLVVLLLPLMLGILNGDAAAPAAPQSLATVAFGWEQAGWALFTMLAGSMLGHLLRLPVRYLLGPMIVSALVHATGLTAFSLPAEVSAIAQVALGATVGCRFRGVELRFLGRTALVSLGSVLLLLAITCGFSFAVSTLSHYSFTALLLAYSPGGLAEMSLIAFALNVEVLFVFCLHIARVLIVALGASLLFRFFDRTAR
ncbi:AbrB family transcriptional regulator [Sinorhizobium meliloti]|nr:AbrB family transcriptional regulator [Sinorhizobium meliloti]MDX0314494.1 AbrB family transcriptional regulator [Sinorhizobium meliloti]